MKLARRLTLATLMVMITVLTLHAMDRISRDRELLRNDTRRDHRALGHALSVVVTESFREDGEQRALGLVAAANEREAAVHVDWVWLPEGAAVHALTAPQVRRLLAGEEAEQLIERAGAPWFISYHPARLSRDRMGAIRIAEALNAEADAVRATVVRTIVSSAIIAVLAGLVTSLLGVWLVGRPIERLMEKARRVGAGDLSGPIELAQRDELAALAREMNAMCDRMGSESEARQRALEQLRHAERLATVGRLAAGVAHELGTPLNVIAIEAKRIAVGRATGAAAQEGASVVATQAERMAAIIRQLLDFARRRTLRPSEVELGALVRETLGLVATLASRQRVALEASALCEVRAEVDPAQLQQVLVNLVMNAVQSMPEGGVVRIESGRGAPPDAPELDAYVRVVDQGSGIPPDALPRIFEPFFTTKELGQGTGLGLAVAHGIVEEHRGRIEVASEPGKGSIFTVRLPSSLEAA